MTKQKKTKIAAVVLAAAVAGLLYLFRGDLFPPRESPSGKTYVYLYPEQEYRCSIYRQAGRWHIGGLPICGGGNPYELYTLCPDGTIRPQFSNDVFHCLEWDPIDAGSIPERRLAWVNWQGGKRWYYDFSEGFCVPGGETEAFLRYILETIGLNETETADLLETWLPELTGSPWNLLAFLVTDQPLRFDLPRECATRRVFLLTQPLDAPVELMPQTFEPFQREGFTVVEWGVVRIDNGK